LNRLLPSLSHNLLASTMATTLLLAGVWIYGREPLRKAYADVSEIGRVQQDAKALERVTKEVDERRARSDARREAKNRICRDLIAGRLTLVTAARQVGALPDAPLHFWELLRLLEKGVTDEERMCWHVIDWACMLVGDESPEVDALRRRLETELRTEFQHRPSRPTPRPRLE